MNQPACRRAVHERSGGLCEARIPGVCLGRASSKHHRRKVSQGGAWTPSNVLDLCGDGTRGCHGWIEANPTAAHELGLWLFTGEGPGVTPCFAWSAGSPGWWVLDDGGGISELPLR